MTTWLYKIDDQQLGPVSFKDLADLVRVGTVGEGTLVCREGTTNWEPAWHVPLLLHAAGIVEPGDSPAVEGSGGPEGAPVQGSGSVANSGATALTPALSQREREQAARRSLLTFADVVRGAIAAAVGLLAVGFFYHWANQAAMTFPMPPTVVDGELIDCYFPVVGRCTIFECGLLYLDVFAVAAVATWNAVGRRSA